MPKIEFLLEEKVIRPGKYANLRKAALKAGIDVYAGADRLLNCHGLGLCGTCTMRIVEGMGNLTPKTEAEERLLAGMPEDARLSCQCEVLGDLCIITNYKPQPRRQ
jgi:ferredoxin